MSKPPQSQSKKPAPPAAMAHGRNDDELDTNFKQSASYMQNSGSEADSSDSDDDSKKKSKSKKAAKKPAPPSDSDSDSGSDAPMPPAASVKKEAAPTAAASSKPNTSLPPVRAPAVPQKLVKAAPGAPPKELTKQQRNQILARERRAAEAAALAAKEGKAAPAAAANAKAAPKPQEDKKRKQPAAADSDSSDSDSDSDDATGGEPMSKAQKASAAATPASTAAASSSSAAVAAKRPGQDLVDTTGMDEKTAKKAIVAAKQAARKAKADARRAEQEAAGTHPTQIDLQLMTRDNAANRLWELFEADRRDREKPLTALEAEELGRLTGKSLAQLPNHESIDGHSFKLLYKALKSMYGPNYQEQVCGGTIQPALSTKQERFSKKRDRAERKAAGDDAVEEEEEAEVRQKQNHIDNPAIGAPYIVFITGSAIRAVEIGRAFKKIPMNTRVVKLFAKHIKMDQQREELSYDVRVVIGTPHRLLKLSEQGYLKWNRAHLILWDIGKTRKLLVAEMQEKRRLKNKVKQGKIDKMPLTIEVRDDEKGNDRKMFTLLSLKDTKSQLWELYERYLSDVLVKKQTAKLVLL